MSKAPRQQRQHDALATETDHAWLIVTDLDGTLLDHFDYSHTPVDPLLARLESAAIPVVLNSSKTLSEMLALQSELQNQHPFICENGSAIVIPRSYFPNLPAGIAALESADGMLILETGTPRETLLRYLEADAVKHDAPYLAFSRASTAEITEATGLSSEQAELAKQRRYSEPLLWRGSEAEKSAFRQRAREAGLATLQGGRFLHLQGPTDKGRTTEILRRCYRHAGREDIALICAGDSENDLDMLAVADVAVIIRAANRPAPVLASTPARRVIVSRAEGPLGWRQVIGELVFPGCGFGEANTDKSINNSTDKRTVKRTKSGKPI
ncbi:mannosyl-3-phosphoglycerate phosphatase [Microbulbifer aestuariivivens]|uniref:Mannosyl-3-phosphoglycerate phosphatase n=1 Tax=Microbulbifer aestuariivivens TaxID=1908308 RepID=A0ABP9WKM4_9GAMM